MTKPKSAKDLLAAGAAEIKAEQAKSKATKKNKGGKSVSSKTPAKDAKDGGTLEIIPEVKECKDPIDEILARRVTFNKEFSSAKLDKETTPGEYVRIYDWARSGVEHSGFVLGDIINAAEAIFGEKYAVALASTGRSINTLKAYAWVARQTPTSLRDRHPDIGFTHLKALAKVPQLEDKKAIVEEMVERAKAGKPMTVPEVSKRADAFKPKKAKKKKAKADDAPDYVMSEDEQRKFSELANAIENAAALAKDGDLKFIKELTADELKEIKANLKVIAKFAEGLE